MKYKILLILMSLFIFMPGVNAEETYYDYEKVEVTELPTSSSDTLNKVYIVNDKYYVTDNTEAGYIPLPLNENLNGKTIYVKDLTSETNNFDYSLKYNFRFAETTLGYHYLQITDSFGYNSLMLSSICGINTFSNNTFVFRYNGNSGRIDYMPSFLVNVDCELRYWLNTDTYDASKLFSLTPFETTYSWKEVNKSQVYEYGVDERDFYLFYSFEDISKFNILSSYDLTSFSDFEKIVVTVLFNILFLGFIGLCFYIFMKFIYKGLSMLFG